MLSFVYRLPVFHGGLQLETDKPSCQVVRARSTAKGFAWTNKAIQADIRLDQVLGRLSSSAALPFGITVSDAD